jgi:poly(beta-D-mannuronate) C5 epimerase
MKPQHPAVLATAALALAASGSLIVFTAGPAQATACNNATVRYAGSTNTIYVQSGSSTFDSLLALCPGLPIVQTDPANHVWELEANITVQNGATLTIDGPGAGGDVAALRLRSLADDLPTDVVQIYADYGTLAFGSVAVTSWDDAANGPDTNYTLAAGEPSTDRARAFIKVSSYLDANSVARESTMTIDGSDFGFLGYYAAESYGVSYKGEGCDMDHLPVCAAVHVYGSETNSTFHDNYMGTYTFDSLNMVFTHDEYKNNVMYGLDTHDDSNNQVVEYDHFDYNADHGYICSQRCSGLVVEYNESDHNGLVPYTGPKPPGDDNSTPQIHGIMLHRGDTNDLIANNYVHDQPNGAGVAVFDSSGDTVRDNTIANNLYGIRLSVGAENLTVSGNQISGSAQYGVFSYQGTDAPEYTNATGRPQGNAFTGNTFTDTGSNAIKLTSSDGFTFTGNTFTGTLTKGFLISNTTGVVFNGNTVPSGLLTSASADSPQTSDFTYQSAPGPVKIQLDSDSTATFTNPAGTSYTVTTSSGSTTYVSHYTPSGGTLSLTSAQVGTGPATVTPGP